MSKAALDPNAPAELKAQLATQLRKVEEEVDEKIREAAVPKKHRFELGAVKSKS